MSDYDKVLLVPTMVSTLKHRGDVDLHSDFLGLFPLISSPMKGISGWELVKEMGKNDCLGILHRFDTVTNRLDNIEKVSNANVPFGVAIGVENTMIELQIAKFAFYHGASLICVDVANGYLPQVAEMGKMLREEFENDIFLMAGNVINKVGSDYIKDAGYDFARIGIGSGNLCTTRQETGIGRNTLEALVDSSHTNIGLVVDGGIKFPGDVNKAFACGADFAMLGSVLAYAYEAENKDGLMYGMASKRNHLENDKEIKSIEGREIQIDIDQKKPLKEILDQFLWGIKSCCTYLNCSSYKEIPYKCEIIEVD